MLYKTATLAFCAQTMAYSPATACLVTGGFDCKLIMWNPYNRLPQPLESGE